jgi:hypothetical protein
VNAVDGGSSLILQCTCNIVLDVLNMSNGVICLLTVALLFSAKILWMH